MTKRKPKSLYVEGFLCLFDDRGEMFYRPKTKLGCPEFCTDDAVDVYIAVEPPPYDDTVEDEGKPLPWPADHCDVPQLFEFNDLDYGFNFVGHFDIDQRGKTIEFGFGEGRMVNCEYEFCDYELYDLETNLSFFKLIRVNLE